MPLLEPSAESALANPHFPNPSPRGLPPKSPPSFLQAVHDVVAVDVLLLHVDVLLAVHVLVVVSSASRFAELLEDAAFCHQIIWSCCPSELEPRSLRMHKELTSGVGGVGAVRVIERM